MESAHKRTSNDHNTSIKRLVEAITGIASRRRPTTSGKLKPTSRNTSIFDDKNEKFEQFLDLIHTMLKKQPDKIEATKSIIFTRI